MNGTIRTRGAGGQGWRIAGWGLAGALLLAPLVAMRYTTEVNWTASDFVFAGVLIGGLGIGVELAVRASGDWAFRAGAVAGLLAAFLLIWVNLAVGLIGSENNDANMMFALVLATATGGTMLARRRPAGMAAAMLAAAAVQGGVALIAQTAQLGDPRPTLVFCLPWLVSAALFRRAAA